MFEKSVGTRKIKGLSTSPKLPHFVRQLFPLKKKYTKNIQKPHFGTQYTKCNNLINRILTRSVENPSSSTKQLKTLHISVIRK